MLWKKTARRWPIDPLKVEYGSVADKMGRNCSRTHVQVQYGGDTSGHLVPLNRFIRETSAALRHAQPLGIQSLRVAPLAWRRYRGFFDRLTDWLPATRAAMRAGGRLRPARDSEAGDRIAS